MDIRAWDQVIDELGPRLYRYFKYKGAQDMASDLTQETFIRLLGVHHRFDAAQGPIIAFALGIAQNVWRENLRKTQTMEPLEKHLHLTEDSDLHAQLENTDQSEKLKMIISRLPQVQQDILYFYFDEEMTTREISESLDIPEGTVKSHLHRSKETIKLILEKELS